MDSLENWLKNRQKDLVEVRRHLHQNPELSGEEKNTQSFLRYRLKTSWPDRLIKVGGTGLLAEYKGESEGKSLLIRVDIDALPISEADSELEYASHNKDAAHKCGHDGHSTIGLGLAHFIAQNRPKKGTVYILFQPAEETAQGAQAVLDDVAFDIKPDYALALHNVPKFPKKSVIIIPDHFTASVRSVIIKFRGQIAHAAEPEQGRSPAAALADLLDYVKEQTINDPNEDNFQLLTPIFLHMGQKAYGTSPSKGELHLTCRCWTTEQMETLVADLEDKVNQLSHHHGLQNHIEYLEVFPTVDQHPELVEALRKVVKSLDFQAIDQDRPFRWGEDFGAISQQFPSLMFGLGAGEDQPVLHHPDYDFPDEIIPDGIRVFYSLIDHLLNS
jgi:amidohydrolase